MFVKNSIRKYLSLLLWRAFNFLENNNNANFVKNGEERFLKNFFKFKKDQNKDYLIIFDVGANKGEYTETLLKLSKKYNIKVEIHLFEPVKYSFEVLLNKFSSNKNLKINNFGLSDENKTALIFYDEIGSGLASVYKRNLKHLGIELNKSEEIILKKAENYIRNNNISHIDLIKIDTEGHEFFVIKGLGEFLSPNFIDFIEFEYGGTYYDSRTSLFDIYTLLESKGFTIAKIMPNGLEIRSYNSMMEIFQYANYVAVSNAVIKK